MEETQLFRLLGTTEIVEVPVDYLDGHKIIYWDAIEDVFPGVKHIMNGRVAIKKRRDSSRKRIEPHYIKHHPRVILEVNASSDTQANIRSDGRTDHHQVKQPPSLWATASRVSPRVALAECESSPAIVSRTSNDHALAESGSSPAIVSRTSNDHALTEQRQGFQKVINKLDVLYDQWATTQQIAQEVLRLHKQMNERLVLIQSKTEAILTQQLEIAEYPIPRLFLVLPEEAVKYDPANWFRTKFRLHFICECGKHTEDSNSKMKHHLHLAKHEGYLVREPTKFFEKYGPFLLLMLQLIKFGTAVAGHVVPALATLRAIELADSGKQTVQLIAAKIDLSVECIEGQLTKVHSSLPEDSVDTELQTLTTPLDLDNYLNDVEGLEG
ncbi:hypothetical protein BGZ70_010642, partial [Mortierella alpina]